MPDPPPPPPPKEEPLPKTNFQKGMDFVLIWEGGYVNDPNDPGGETKFGISKRAHPELDIKNLTRQDAEEVYWKDYWGKAGCHGIDDGRLQIALFDTAVNLGTSRARSMLKRTCELPTNKVDYAEILLILRKYYYVDLAISEDRFQKYIKGWLNRVRDLEKFLEIEDVK